MFAVKRAQRELLPESTGIIGKRAAIAVLAAMRRFLNPTASLMLAVAGQASMSRLKTHKSMSTSMEALVCAVSK